MGVSAFQNKGFIEASTLKVINPVSMSVTFVAAGISPLQLSSAQGRCYGSLAHMRVSHAVRFGLQLYLPKPWG